MIQANGLWLYIYMFIYVYTNNSFKHAQVVINMGGVRNEKEGGEKNIDAVFIYDILKTNKHL